MASKKKTKEEKRIPILNRARNGLAVFQKIVVDKSLPKYSRPKSELNDSSRLVLKDKSSLSPSEDFPPFNVYNSSGELTNMASLTSYFEQSSESKRLRGSSDKTATIDRYYIRDINDDNDDVDESDHWGYWDLHDKWKAYVDSKNKVSGYVVADSRARSKIKPMTIQQFFSSAKNGADEIKIVSERALSYERLLVDAKSSGQRTLLENLMNSYALYRAETQLAIKGITRYITEAKLAEFVAKTDRSEHLYLDYIADFSRPIPSDIVSKKEQLDNLLIFDNYLVLNYDSSRNPDAESATVVADRNASAAEHNRKKDPILFGVISGRNVLYYIGDWIDEKCDLTLEAILDSMGDSAVLETSPDSSFQSSVPKGRAKIQKGSLSKITSAV